MQPLHRVLWISWNADPGKRVNCTEWCKAGDQAFLEARDQVLHAFSSSLLIVWIVKDTDETAIAMTIEGYLARLYKALEDGHKYRTVLRRTWRAVWERPHRVEGKGIFHLYVDSSGRERR